MRVVLLITLLSKTSRSFAMVAAKRCCSLCAAGSCKCSVCSYAVTIGSFGAKQDNFSGTYRSASSLLGSLQDEPGELDLFSKSAKLRGSPVGMLLFTHFEGWGRDFDGAAWFPELAQKPLFLNAPVKRGRIEDR